MTTRVVIANFGPDEVSVETVSRKGSEPQALTGQRIEPFAVAEFWIHEGADLRVVECPQTMATSA